jgi:hypothetical protein
MHAFQRAMGRQRQRRSFNYLAFNNAGVAHKDTDKAFQELAIEK